ncbi:DnaA/Hda family protein [Asticcacaulis sp. BYS171W]|uniref:DnaA/Hda family protein n=1 Tax=Asticcacaulis aquaticus TaxID=2984212 RepID=A0ABT5HQE3_9CAUL|nr:DnaA/Hda family protein [Asticcacaulis aquaticus]MDC7681681.1 DnaA/Hda family protein [Asticcacaulis aquaticus]
MSHQLHLDLSLPDRLKAKDFVVSEANDDLHSLLMTPQAWLNPCLVLTGPEGSGKTHAGHLFAETHAAVWLEHGQTLPPSGAFVVVDDADAFDQETLFHLFNLTTSANGRLLLLSRRHPAQWRISVPDFESRLKAMRVVDMPEPDDALLKQVLKKLFETRVITPSDDVLEYLSRRMERSFAHAQKIVTGIEDYANGRAFTRVLARDFIDKYENLSWLSDEDGI